MIVFKTGNIFSSKADVLVNPINCVGVMGAGLAKQFKEKYPEMYFEYKRLCDEGTIKVGEVSFFKSLDSNKGILNFPTKQHFKDNSKLEWIDLGLKHFVQNYTSWGISSIAFPLLGCGLGGLSKSSVKELLKFHLSNLDIEVEVYE